MSNETPSTDLAWAEARDERTKNMTADFDRNHTYLEHKSMNAATGYYEGHKTGADFGRAYALSSEAKRAEGLIAALKQIGAGKETNQTRVRMSEADMRELANEALSTYRNGAANG